MSSKKFTYTVKGLCGRCLFVRGPLLHPSYTPPPYTPYTVYVYLYFSHRGWGKAYQRKLEAVYKAG